MTRARYTLKETLDGQPVHDGLFDNGIGIVMHGDVITPYSDEHEAALKADPRFKQYRGAESVTPDATVSTEAPRMDADAKSARKGKE